MYTIRYTSLILQVLRVLEIKFWRMRVTDDQNKLLLRLRMLLQQPLLLLLISTAIML